MALILRTMGTGTVLAVSLPAALPLAKRLALPLPITKAKESRDAMTARAPGTWKWDQLVARTPALAEDLPRPVGSDTAVLQYTGGTTGRPKGAVLTHRNLRANAAQGRAWVPGLNDGDEVVYAVLPLFHAYGLTLCLTFTVSIGATLVLFPRFDVDLLLEAQRRRPATFLPRCRRSTRGSPGPPPIANVDLTSIRFAISGAMALAPKIAELWESVSGGVLVEGYGMTETSPVALGNPMGPSRRVGAIGVPFPSTEVRVVDRDDPTKELPHGQPGQLLLHGPQVFTGYWNRPEETDATILPEGWIRTGDIVVMDDDGFFTLVDRIKEVIITGGFNVYPTEVEEVLRQVPGVVDAAVVGLPSPNGGEDVTAAVILEPDSSFDEGALRDATRERLAAYKVPRRLYVLDELPRSVIGKVLRREVRDRLQKLREEG